jgi:hypothetical protein
MRRVALCVRRLARSRSLALIPLHNTWDSITHCTLQNKSHIYTLYINYMHHSIKINLCVCSHYSLTPCQVGKYDIRRVTLVISTRLTRAVYISIRNSTVTNCEVNKQSTPISMFPRTPRLCHPSLVHLLLYVQYKIVTK